VTESAIKEADPGTLCKEEPLVNVDPPCLNFTDEHEGHTIQITMDRSMPHTNLKRHALWDFEMFEREVFLNYERKKFDLEMSAYWQVNTMIPSNGCRHILKSTNRWN